MEAISMLLTCPLCSSRHVDAHACQSCGHCWRPAVVPTIGVQFLPGFSDSPPVESQLQKERDEAREQLQICQSKLIAIGIIYRDGLRGPWNGGRTVSVAFESIRGVLDGATGLKEAIDHEFAEIKRAGEEVEEKKKTAVEAMRSLLATWTGDVG